MARLTKARIISIGGGLGHVSTQPNALPNLPPNFAEWLASLNQPPPEPAPDYGPGPDYGGYVVDGGGGGTTIIEAPAPPAPPPYDPNTDPAFQQLMAQLGLSENTARTQAAQKISDAQTEGTIASPRIQEQGAIQRRNISLGWEGRGLYRSGARLRDLAQQQSGETARLGDITRGTARQVSSINQTLQQQIDDLAAKRADANFQAKLRSSQSPGG